MSTNVGLFFKYSPFHKNLPRSSLQMHWISVRFYEMGDIQIYSVNASVFGMFHFPAKTMQYNIQPADIKFEVNDLNF